MCFRTGEKKRQRPKNRDGFRVAIICALQHEADAVEAMFDIVYDHDGAHYAKAPGDSNNYTTGAIGQHHVVLVHMPEIGRVSCTGVVENLRKSYTRISLSFVVGICGAAPYNNQNAEIILGDVIISQESVQGYFDQRFPEGSRRRDTRIGTPNKARPAMLKFLENLADARNQRDVVTRTQQYVLQGCQDPNYQQFKYPGNHFDILFHAEYRHKHRDRNTRCSTCLKCKTDKDPVCNEAIFAGCQTLGCLQDRSARLVSRRRLTSANPLPQVHYGTIVSNEKVIKSAKYREYLNRESKVLGFEMEGNGVWDDLPILIIKSAYDYADTHKSNTFQTYAALTAAACSKAALEICAPIN